MSGSNYDVILFHDDALKDKKIKELIIHSKVSKIYVSNKKLLIQL